MHRSSTAEARNRFALAGAPLVLLAVLLASTALFRPFPHDEVASALASWSPTVQQTVGRAFEVPSQRRERTAFIRPASPTVARVHVSAGRDSDGARGADGIGAPTAFAWWLGPVRAPGATVAARARGTPAPGQPAPSSRAPPLL